MQKALYWAPRILAILSILFISMFALDVFEPDKPWHYIAVALFMHLLPSLVLIAILIVAWRIEWLGGLLFVAAGLSPFLLLRNPAWVNLLIGGPFVLTGLLFIAGHRLRRGEKAEERTP